MATDTKMITLRFTMQPSNEQLSTLAIFAEFVDFCKKNNGHAESILMVTMPDEIAVIAMLRWGKYLEVIK